MPNKPERCSLLNGKSNICADITILRGIIKSSEFFFEPNCISTIWHCCNTAAHEYGHTLGLGHPANLDCRGKGAPGIMYPRGTLVDPQFQYDPSKPAGITGGTMHPMYRKVFAEDIAALKLDKLRFVNQKAVAGDFTNVFH